MTNKEKAFCRHYFELVILVLTANFPFKLSKQDLLSTLDLEAIEFFLKKMSKHPISEKATYLESVYLFDVRTDLIRGGDAEEIRHLYEEISANVMIIGEEIAKKLRRIIGNFARWSTTK